MEERIIELETKISYQDQLIEDLNKVVIELRMQLDKLEVRYAQLTTDLKESSVKDLSQEVPPPHY